jgi:glycosyltransferase involved in cell wall biosynthesis
VIGTGSLEEELRYKYGNKFKFLGYCNREIVYNNMNEADYIVVPSLVEQFGLVLLEGIAAGCVPIVTNVGGMAQIMKEMRGFLVELDIDTFSRPFLAADKLEHAIYNAINEDKNVIESIRLDNYLVLCKNYSLKNMYEKTTLAYEKSITNLL